MAGRLLLLIFWVALGKQLWLRNCPGCSWSQLPWYGKMAGKLLLLPQPEYTPYLKVLPDISLPASWSRDDLEQLQCDYMIARVEQEQQEWQQLAALLGPWLASERISKERFFWALSTVRSRAFSGPCFSVPFSVITGIFASLQAFTACGALGIFEGFPPVPWQVTEALAVAVPAGLVTLDLQSAQKKVGYDFVKEAYSVSSCRDYRPGEEVLISYGELSNDACLQLYGFVENDNPYDRYIFQDLGSRLLQGPLGQKAGAGAKAFLQQSITDARASGLLTQVPVTANGFPTEVVQFVQRLSSELTDLSPVGSSAELAQRTLRDACKKELQMGFPTTLDEDMRQLEELDLQVSKYKLEKMMMSQNDETGESPPGQQPPGGGPTQPEHKTEAAGPSAEANSSPTLQWTDQPPSPSSGSAEPAAEIAAAADTAPAAAGASVVGSEAAAAAPASEASEAATPALESSQAATPASGAAEGDARAVGARPPNAEQAPGIFERAAASGFGDDSGGGPGMDNSGPENIQEGSQPALPELDLEEVARSKLCLCYRIQKKRLLAGIVMPIREVRYDSRQ
ncbi:hypothetical protein DUNSADRAFT_531 [Dunaliella salina]|uniref:Rubisco LSMT substrate-binding domain-containing protein n=1 Tax=Dunaliella salina TaxID=3046 RepID=A0ABQ7GY78_DUNSA|nr:hypothetical protein DUNSADRAFT_531 [Dunaliella salina]|eukprot:KAF5839557.1 hypothetical protein DUNSADRAFT_531 [Dunaliella salina]